MLLTGGTARLIDVMDGTIYSGPGVGEVSTSVLDVRVPVPGGTLQSLRVTTSVAIFIGTTVEVTVAINGLDTSLTCQITGFGGACDDLVNTPVTNAGDSVAVKILQTGLGAPTRVNYSFELAPTPPPG